VKTPLGHLAYCTNIHPAESWEETMRVLETHALAVRDQLECTEPFALGLRLSARAAHELLQADHLPRFQDWLAATNTYVFTINGFPYGGFHGQRVKERVFQPDWTSPDRITYTQQLFRILTTIADPAAGASVSTLPGSHKSFQADESLILHNLRDFARWLDDLADSSGIDLHLGLEPEPFGHIENTQETLAFFDKLTAGDTSGAIARRIGINYDACHFAIEFDDARSSLDQLHAAGIRISKIHLSNALSIDPQNPAALAALRSFDEPVYFHQVIARAKDGTLARFPDLPDFLAVPPADLLEARIHFHIPLDVDPPAPLGSTRSETGHVIAWCQQNPGTCPHFEIETYTWAVLPDTMRRPVEDQIAAEYRWVLKSLHES
jgi:hypothetical protein